MKVFITKDEAELMRLYHISNFDQLIEVYRATRDERLERIISASQACMIAQY